MAKGWSQDDGGHPVYESADGSRMRVVPPETGSRHRRWRTENFRNGVWEDNYRAFDSDVEAKKHVEDICAHRIEVVALGRTDIHLTGGVRVHTPWGHAQGGTRYGEGVVSYHTGGHGGFKLDAARNRLVHEAWRAAGGWYEEDCEWAVVARTFPELFTAWERDRADDTLKNSKPYQYAEVTGETVALADSLVLREAHHHALHRNDWMAVSAITSGDHAGMVEVTATVGGERGADAKTFLVPSDEYTNIPGQPFVIDPARHEEIAPAGPAPRA